MLENAIYSVISRRMCNYTWKIQKNVDAARAMELSANDLLELKVIDEIIPEPTGGAHRDKNTILSNVSKSISKNLILLRK